MLRCNKMKAGFLGAVIYIPLWIIFMTSTTNEKTVYTSSLVFFFKSSRIFFSKELSLYLFFLFLCRQPLPLRSHYYTFSYKFIGGIPANPKT